MPWNQWWNQRSVLLRLRTVVLLLAAAVCLSCGGDDDGGPTAPQDFAVAFTGAITNLDCACLQDFEILFDGRVLNTIRSTSPTRSQVWSASVLTPRGQHQVGIRPIRQTSTASEYLLLGSIDVFSVTGTRGQIADIELQDRLTTLRAGEGVSWTFTF